MAKKGEYIPKINLTGKRYGKLKVLRYAGYNFTKSGITKHLWECKCDCGKIKIASTTSLQSGHCKSCGCISHRPHTQANRIHGMTDTKIYNVWKNMKGRCYTKSNTDFKNYGGRGICVCDEWKNDFLSFYKWAIKNGYDENAKRGECTLDRIDVNGNYEPSNCQWINMKMQANNKRLTKRWFVNGEYITMPEASEKYNVPYDLIRSRVLHGDTLEKALFADHSNVVNYTIDGVSHTLPKWCEIYNMKYITVHARIKRYGWDLKKALETPPEKGNRWRKKS